MQTGQMLLTLGALVLLSMGILNLNRHLATSDIQLAQNRYRLEALSIMTSYVEQASQYFFDEVSTDTTSEKNLADFTAPNHLGFDPDDSSRVDDFDDFCNVTLIDTGNSGVVYKVMFQVDYVKLQGDSIVPSNQREYNKRMTISITDNYADPLLFKYVNGIKQRDTLRISVVNSYWFYN